MKVRLIATRWDQRTPKGIARRRRGEQFTVKDDVADWLIRSGAAEQAGRAPSAPSSAPVTPADVIEDLDDEGLDPEVPADEFDEDDGDETDDSEPGASERPAQSAPKSAWVAYAVSRGIPAKEAEGMDKPKLISRTA